MSIRYTSISRASVGRGPKSSLLNPWFRRRTPSISTSYTPITLSPGAVANTKTAWTQVVASTSGAVGAIRLRIQSGYALVAAQATLIDIGTGGSGSETVIIPNIPVGAAANQTFGGIFLEIPISIPSGTRVAIRAQSQRTSFSFSINVVLIAASDTATTPRSVDSLGVSTSTSSGTSMSGASGTYVQIVSSTTKDYQAVIVIPSIAASAGLGTLTNSVLTVAVGAAGSEVDITQSVFSTDGGIGFGNPVLMGDRGGVLIPAGSRLSIKHNIAASPGNTAGSIIGVPYV